MAAGAGPPLRAMLWAPRDVDTVRAFATQPTECLRPPADPATALSVEVGRAAFRTPIVLGGHAARSGLSCESCHRGGRGNPDFQFPGVSGAPGTADVTHSLFSARRGNGLDDPRPIPDLAAPKAALKVDQARSGRALEDFVTGLIVEEFDGPRPTPAVLDGLAAYVRALDPAACPTADREPVSVATLMADAGRALAAGQASLFKGDPATAVMMVAAARARLGLIDERFADLPAERARLRRADTRLAALQQAIRERRPQAAAGLRTWLARAPALEARLAAREPASLFDRNGLQQSAKRRLRG